ncbi:MAG: CoA transferase [Hylemonella sp.]|uniref:CoA transferase n=1 Tax=Hylemonella sp. TaxID=2066020 RepID=UPI0022C6F842|nr:CoA transferase [Hylemonella sp.]MCZ8251293.1 CoA transferase [Hylemonella sp.]
MMARNPKPLRGERILSLALNLPGPAALMRLHILGARCAKLEPPAGDPMQAYRPEAYAALHQSIRVLQADLKSDAGRRTLHRELARSDVLLTSFRPSALKRLGLDWTTLHQLFPALCLVAIVGAPGKAAEIPGHDLTYMAEQGLVQGLNLPPTLYADMGGALLAVEAVLQALMARAQKGTGVRQEVALSDAAAWLGLPRHWGLVSPTSAVGGGHAGYRVYACKDGRVAVAALEPHFAQALCGAAGLKPAAMMAPAVHRALEAWFAQQTRRTLDALAQRLDLPLHTLPKN